MDKTPILTIVVPTYNMEKYLPHNLESIIAANCKSLEVLVLDNSSTDGSGHIADAYAKKYPSLFTVYHKENRGYGSSINLAIEKAKGRYLRIVDADDWIVSEALTELVTQLKKQNADLILMPYRTVNIKTGEEILRSSAPEEWKVGDTQLLFCEESCSVPQLHETIFRVDFLRKIGITLLENAYYVDEQLMIWTYMSAQSACRLDVDIYRYCIGRETQSISSYNMGLHYYDRERVIRSCLDYQHALEERNLLERTCLRQLAQNIGNHFTTLYIYVTPRKVGRRLAKEWQKFVQENVPDLWKLVEKKARLLFILSLVHISPMWYRKIKGCPVLRKATQ